jgi:adenosylhomocysteine nucleosidase
VHDSAKVAIVAALEREVRGLTKNWSVREREYEGRRFRFFEHDSVVLVCGGMGVEAARRATEAAIALYHPLRVQSVGFAGALDPALKVGTIFIPGRVIDAGDGSSVETHSGAGVLVTFGSVAGAEQKRNLAAAYGAQAVDMEAAAVARGAAAHGVGFSAVKAISDEAGFVLPDMDRFAGSDGRFRQAKFLIHAGIRPRLWSGVFKLAANAVKAAKALCAELERQNSDAEWVASNERGYQTSKWQ